MKKRNPKDFINFTAEYFPAPAKKKKRKKPSAQYVCASSGELL